MSDQRRRSEERLHRAAVSNAHRQAPEPEEPLDDVEEEDVQGRTLEQRAMWLDAQVRDELGGDPFAGLADRVARADPGQQGLGLGGGEVLLGATGQHFQQDPVQLADLAGVLVPDRAAPVDQQLQHFELQRLTPMLC